MQAMMREAPLAVLAHLGVFLISADGSIELLPEDDPMPEALQEQFG